MSIATDVSRIKGNITAALAAIANKGVTVPDGSTSDALAALIESIEAGGGGTKVVTGTFTLAEDQTEYYYPSVDYSSLIIEGETEETVRKRLAVVVSISDPNSEFYDVGTYCFAQVPINLYGTGGGFSVGYGGGYHDSVYSGTITLTESTPLRLKFGTSNEQIGKAGYTYRYWIWRAFDI